LRGPPIAPRLAVGMNTRELEDYQRTRIPLAKAMAVEVRVASESGVTLFAPLAPNINHRDTVFGGSASAVAILAAWSALHVRMRSEGQEGRIVIRSNTMTYERPITAGFTATAAPPEPAAWQKFTATLVRGRMARARLIAILDCDGTRVGSLDAEFAVMPHTASSTMRQPDAPAR
jgi:thioesterase domain-containing protein